jgi:hypothetical protein
VSARLSELTASTQRLALVGLAKNTGKTVALGTLLRELEAAGRRVGVTSVGRDGEERDVIDSRIEKPRIELAGGSLVATTDSLLRSSGIPHELLEQTDVRTPLGRVLVARLRGAGAIEVAGPSAAEQVRTVSDAMLAHGAEMVLIDGAIDRRAASSPDVADALVVSTGAVLSEELSEVVRRTAEAVELVRLPPAALDGAPLTLEPQFTLTAEAEQVADLLDNAPNARQLIVPGALPDRFLDSLAKVVHRRRRELVLVVRDPTKVFLLERGLAWYERQGVRMQAAHPIALAAITVNPLAPQSHRFDSARLREALEASIADVPILDVLAK